MKITENDSLQIYSSELFNHTTKLKYKLLESNSTSTDILNIYLLKKYSNVIDQI
jgi:hypothetical protein